MRFCDNYAVIIDITTEEKQRWKLKSHVMDDYGQRVGNYEFKFAADLKCIKKS